MNALYWKKFRCRHTRSLASCTGHAASPHPGSGQGNREPAANPIAICSSRLPSSSSRNSTPDTLHGSGSCRAAVNNDVVSIPPNYPTSTTTPPTHSPTPNSERPNEITESVSALGIHHSTPLAEEMVDSISVVHEVVLGSDTLRTR